VVEGQPVPVTRTGVAAYNGMSYNSVIAREKSFKAQAEKENITIDHEGPQHFNKFS